jgi:hypothetical protein
MSDEEKKSGRLSFRVADSLEQAVRDLADETGWDMADICRCTFLVFWPDIEAMVLTTKPNPKPEQIGEMREMAKLLRAARAQKLDLRKTLIDAVENKIAEQAMMQ